MYLGIIGFLMVAVIITLLLTKKMSPIALFIIVPVIGGIVAGYSITEVIEFCKAGVSGNLSNSMMIAFAVLFFSTIIDSGAFNRIVSKLIKLIGNRVMVLTVLTVVITIIGHLDGSGPSTFLIAIVPLLPIYKKLGISPKKLLCITCLTAGICNIVPWGGPIGRASAALSIEATEIWRYALPMQAVGLICMVAIAVLFAKQEKSRLSTLTSEVTGGDSEVDLNAGLNPDLLRPKMFIPNIILIVVTILTLIFADIPGHLVFMFAFAVALALNYPKASDQIKVFKAHCGDAFFVSSVIFAAGFLSGVITKSEIASEMANLVLRVVPDMFTPVMHIIWGFLATPLMSIGVTADVQCYGIYPVLAEVAAGYGAGAAQLAAFWLLPLGVASFIAPTTAATYLAIGLADVQIDEHLKFSFKYAWAVGAIMVVSGLLFGIVPL